MKLKLRTEAHVKGLTMKQLHIEKNAGVGVSCADLGVVFKTVLGHAPTLSCMLPLMESVSQSIFSSIISLMYGVHACVFTYLHICTSL